MLLQVIEFKNKKWITSKKLHDDMQPTSSVTNTNKAIREMPAFSQLVAEGHLLLIDRNYAKSFSDSILESLILSNSYRPILLIDPVAQKRSSTTLR